MVFRLSPKVITFPDPALADEDGLLAIGGDLSEARLLQAYRQGIFPWYNEEDPICWYAPKARCVIFSERVKVSKSMQQVLRKGLFEVTFNQAFGAVIGHCAGISRKGQTGTWIGPDMQEAYMRLHESGHAHSVEVWRDGRLAGGLYGIVTDRVFCGESMFSLEPNASKTALIWLCRQNQYPLIDCQMPNEHLMSLGAEMIPMEEYRHLLQQYA
ncbi:leucyl/phenylalanyl-tRNA--protein transferase [Taibaiella chishuiensis]|uniref:Leucyl/phenylalanyl-tRNA--protein transferase n=1 Tax=Taibaiella chishuiensis TaxID=1434707 RepID=A0A2P8D464_9BACT|nr:leucyl/phenylalanyl-tRNA--protein transferase [Taibaiella chishuiensis]PSK92010.1 leucyl/phenylalanyl-tRNA--protein transferase [Taibaiella chishuiensis]